MIPIDGQYQLLTPCQRVEELDHALPSLGARAYVLAAHAPCKAKFKDD